MSRITTYAPLPISFTHGKGVWLYDHLGKAYFDSFSGIAVNGLGHTHPDIVKAIQRQVKKVIHVSNGFRILEQEALAERLCSMTGMYQAFFSNSGAEANEAAIKLARLYGHAKNIETPSIIVMEKAFHGRTLATITAGGSRKIQAGFEPLVPGFIRAPLHDIQALRTIASHRNDVVAIMVEPILGEAGVIELEATYMHALANLCHEKGWLLILDEVQTGNGRTGKYFCYEHMGITPDIITTAKGLANGIPLGATLIGKAAADLFKPGNHGSTFGGNPLACRTALTVLDVIERDTLLTSVSELGSFLKEALIDMYQGYPQIKNIRGRGFMIGIEMDRPAAPIKTISLEYGLLLNVTAESVIRIMPPLICTKSHIQTFLKRLKQSIDHFLSEKHS